MKIGICSDHRGYNTKKELTNILKEKGYTIIDYGTYNDASTDYPIYAFKLCEAIKENYADFGIALCGTGIGMSIAANKVKGIRCAKTDNLVDAKYAKRHNNANVLAISANKKIDDIIDMIILFTNEEVDKEEKYKRRNDMIKRYEDEH